MIDPIVLEDLDRIKSDLNKEDFEGKRFLVTGGAGFIGSWLCDVLVGLGAEVVCLDNFATGIEANVDHLFGNPGFKLVRGDVCTFEGGGRFDCILHLASRASPEEYQEHPVETLRTNSFGGVNMAELARKQDAAILFASTSEVYGDAEIVPTPENYWGNVNPVGLRSCYFEGKRFAEALFMAYCRKHGLNVRIARIFNSYGPRLREDGLYGRAVSRFVTQALTGRSITLYGDGTQTRSFCYITDMAVSLLWLMVNANAKGEVVNVGSNHEISIQDLAEKVRQMASSGSRMTFHPLPEDDPKRRCPDIGKAERILGWRPKVRLEQGLERTMAWFRNKLAHGLNSDIQAESLKS